MTGRRRTTEIEVKQEPLVSLYNKYRPQTFEELFGQQDVVKSIKSLLKNKTSIPHSYLFLGPAGTGKTTLARILAKQFNVSPNNIIEVDAASNTGVDDMRSVTETLKYHGFGEQPNKLIILDEVHFLSKNAWASILKSVEEPPHHVYFALCTTEVAKVPETIKTRCTTYNLKPLKPDDVFDLLRYVCDEEDWDVDDKFLDMIVRKSEGSARGALSRLAMVHDCQSKEDVASLLDEPLDNAELINIMRQLVSGKGDWASICTTLKGLNETPEAIRIIMINYLAAVLINAKKESEIIRLLEMVAEFSKPMNQSDKLAPILLAIGNILYPA